MGCIWSAYVSKDRTHWKCERLHFNPAETLWSLCNGMFTSMTQPVASEWLSASISVCVTVKWTSLTYCTHSQCFLLSMAFMQKLSLQLEKKFNILFSTPWKTNKGSAEIFLTLKRKALCQCTKLSACTCSVFALYTVSVQVLHYTEMILQKYHCRTPLKESCITECKCCKTANGELQIYTTEHITLLVVFFFPHV